WASLIKDRVSTRAMPPWPLDVTVGVQEFKNDRSLTNKEIQTIVSWVDAGAPMGDLADLPEPIEWPTWEDGWAYADRFGRQPDLVIVSPTYRVPGSGMDHWPNLTTTVEGLDEERWIMALELR